MNTIKLAGFSTFDFTHDGLTMTVYRRGEGPGVILMHEIPGITPQVKAGAEWVADAGFTVFMPSMFGTPDKPLSVPYVLGQMFRAITPRRARTPPLTSS